MYLKPNTNNFPIILFPEKSHLLSHPHPLHFVFISPKHMKLIPRANLWVAKPTATQKQVKSSAHSNKVLYRRGSIQDIRQGRCTGRKTKSDNIFFSFNLQLSLFQLLTTLPHPNREALAFDIQSPHWPHTTAKFDFCWSTVLVAERALSFPLFSRQSFRTKLQVVHVEFNSYAGPNISEKSFQGSTNEYEFAVLW